MLYLTQRLEIPAAATASVTLPIRVKSRVKVTLNDGREAAAAARAGAARRRCAQQRRRHRVCAGDCR
ncbi:hypothetical protein J4734_28045 [Klebsiella pneumoniae]|uniref:Urease accessory protein UreE n=1 Tax=Klebsiella pneumoniae TaxID=573 RepID=A0A939NQL5_KLEPN|nr:hypothetical protein [Klebsiella pneumoniae]